MKTVGIIGGIGPESTIDYYRSMIAVYRQESTDGSNPSIIINSVNMQKMLAMFEASKFAEVAEYLVPELQRLAGAGADFGLLAANTPHIVFDEIQRWTQIHVRAAVARLLA